MKLFLEAIKIDQTYAKAYSGLSDAYLIASNYGYVDLTEGRSKHMEAVKRSLDLDDSLPEAHASMGSVLILDLRYEEAQRELRRAIELNPSHASAHHWYSLCLVELGGLDAAINEITIARQLDPLSPVISHALAMEIVAAGRVDEGLAILDKLIEREPTYLNGYSARSICFALKHVKDKSFADWETFHALHNDEEYDKLMLSQLHSWFGDKEKARILVQEVLRETQGSPKYPAIMASSQALLGEKDEFFLWVDKAIGAKVFSVWLLRYTPFFDDMKVDPRFSEIFQKLGLPYRRDSGCAGSGRIPNKEPVDYRKASPGSRPSQVEESGLYNRSVDS